MTALLTSRRFNTAAAIIFVDEVTMEILLLKRAENISFGGYFAFPGGNVEA